MTVAKVRDFILGLAQILLRSLPWPAKTGLIRVGNPGRDAPVLITCNYNLTVRRVLRALRGLDVYLLVAPTKGINVWCGAAGGYFTAHQVISILRTSGIGELVDHRRLILPQLSATGIERKLVEQRTGWRVVFGPVYASDIPAYLAENRKTEAMRQVRFGLSDRLEMAAVWAFPFSMIGGGVLAIDWRQLLLPFVAMTWALALGLYVFLPWLSGTVDATRHPQATWVRYLILFDPRLRWNSIVWLLFLAALCGQAYVRGALHVRSLAGWSLASLFVMLFISMDLAGSTPVYKSGLHEDRLLHVDLNTEACKGRAMCREVCPKNCYVIDAVAHKAAIAMPDACVQCGACIVQCPEDALAFVTPAGERIPPEVIRTYKLNLLGARARSIADEGRSISDRS
ncbi:MAG TPA: HgcAB-like fusion protein [Candidatus Polarisedimenticolia bacterium]|nr:HgcAB-like fusion protein [Candidatus Polarisedimenticolia bacterium]